MVYPAFCDLHSCQRSLFLAFSFCLKLCGLGCGSSLPSLPEGQVVSQVMGNLSCPFHSPDIDLNKEQKQQPQAPYCIPIPNSPSELLLLIKEDFVSEIEADKVKSLGSLLEIISQGSLSREDNCLMSFSLRLKIKSRTSTLFWN